MIDKPDMMDKLESLETSLNELKSVATLNLAATATILYIMSVEYGILDEDMPPEIGEEVSNMIVSIEQTMKILEQSLNSDLMDVTIHH